MSEIKELEIKRMEFDVTRNGDISTRIFVDDTTSYVFYDGYHFFQSCSAGFKIQYRTNEVKRDGLVSNIFYNVVIPEAYSELYNSDKAVGRMMRRMAINFRTALCQAKNGEKNELTEYEVDNYIEENLFERQKFVDKVFQLVEEAKDGFYAYLGKQLNIKKASRNCDPENTIQSLGLEMYKEFKKNFRMSREEV